MRHTLHVYRNRTTTKQRVLHVCNTPARARQSTGNAWGQSPCTESQKRGPKPKLLFRQIVVHSWLYIPPSHEPASYDLDFAAANYDWTRTNNTKTQKYTKSNTSYAPKNKHTYTNTPITYEQLNTIEAINNTRKRETNNMRTQQWQQRTKNIQKQPQQRVEKTGMCEHT